MEIERAGWRQSAAVPRTPLGIFLGRDRAHGMPVSWLLFGVSLLYVGLRLVFEASLVKWLADILGLAAFFPALLLFVVLLGPARPLETLAPDPAPGPSFHTWVDFFRGFRKTGDDQGVLAFADGWLVYEGRETSFALRPSDVREVVRIDSKWRLVLDEGQRVEIGGTIRLPESFEEEFDRWRFGPTPSGLSRLPPLESRYPARSNSAALLHGLGPMILGIVSGIFLKDALLGTLKPTHWSLLGWVALIAFALSGLGRLLLWDRRRLG